MALEKGAQLSALKGKGQMENRQWKIAQAAQRHVE
jgi:hypothetical protein